MVEKVARLAGSIAEAVMAKVKEALKAILQGLVAAAMAAMLKIIELAVRALVELVDKIGRTVLKMVLKVISLLFGFPGGYFDASWMETQALIRI